MRLPRLALLALLAVGPSARAGVIYDSIPAPDPASSPSLGYQATSTSEFGDRIGFAGTDRQLASVRVGLVSWAFETDPFTDPSLVTVAGVGWYQDLTFNIYAVGPGGTLGSLLATKTSTFLIPWRETSPILAPVTFDFLGDEIVLPDEVIYGLAFNTQSYGTSPTGFTGPYNSLNFAVGGNGPGYIPPSVGTDVNPDSVFWNTSNAGFYTDGGAGGVGVFREDTNWSPYSPWVEVNAVPEPGSMALLGLGSIGMGIASRRRRQKQAAAQEQAA